MRLWLLVLCALGFVSTVRAQSLRVDQSAERMRVDGSLREWRGARFSTFGSGDDAALRVALATADGGLYVGAEVSDETLLREGNVGTRQDAVVLTLVMPQAGGAFESVDVWLYPGARGSKAVGGLAREGQRPKAEPRVKVVEGPGERGGGYVIEAFVPWSLVPGSDLWEQGRAAIRFEDVDQGGKVESVVRSAQASRASDLPRLVLGEGHQDLLGAFLNSQGLTGVEPRFDFRGNVSGDKAPERVAIVDRFVVVYGPKYKKGEAFGYMALPLGPGGSLRSASLEDVTGDGLDELLLVLRQKNELGARELWMVVSFVTEDPKPQFGIELKKEVKGGAFVENKLALVREKGGLLVRLTVGQAQGLDASSYRESPASDVEPILLPWGDIESRSYRFDGTRFARVEEKKREVKAAPVATKPAEPAPHAAPAESEEPVEASVENVLALFKKEREIAKNARPTRQLTDNLFGGPTREHLFVFDTTLVILGGDLGDGASYMAYGLPIPNPADFLYVGSGDVTGDGVSEIFVRIKQPLSGAEGVHRELALVLRFDQLGRFGRALAVDVTRRMGAQVVANRVRTRGGKLVIDPGTAEGWDGSNYPFTNEAAGGADRLLLPWADKPVSYRLEGDRFMAK